MNRFKSLILLVVLFLGLLSVGPIVFGQTTINDHRLYAAQMATGWQGTPGQPGSTEWRTEIWVANLTNREIVVDAGIFNNKAGALISRIFRSDGSELVPGNRFRFNLFSGQNATYTLRGCGTCQAGSKFLMTGSILFRVPATWNTATSRYEPDVAISVVYKQLDYQGRELAAAGVNVDAGGTRYVVQAVITGNLNNGVSILNPEYPGFQPTWGPIRVKLELFNSYGLNTVAIAVKELTIQPGEQISQFVSELFPNLPLDPLGNPLTDGNLKITAERPVAVTTLKTYSYPGSFIIAGVPVGVLK